MQKTENRRAHQNTIKIASELCAADDNFFRIALVFSPLLTQTLWVVFILSCHSFTSSNSRPILLIPNTPSTPYTLIQHVHFPVFVTSPVSRIQWNSTSSLAIGWSVSTSGTMQDIFPGVTRFRVDGKAILFLLDE